MMNDYLLTTSETIWTSTAPVVVTKPSVNTTSSTVITASSIPEVDSTVKPTKNQFNLLPSPPASSVFTANPSQFDTFSVCSHDEDEDEDKLSHEKLVSPTTKPTTTPAFDLLGFESSSNPPSNTVVDDFWLPTNSTSLQSVDKSIVFDFPSKPMSNGSIPPENPVPSEFFSSANTTSKHKISGTISESKSSTSSNAISAAPVLKPNGPIKSTGTIDPFSVDPFVRDPLDVDPFPKSTLLPTKQQSVAGSNVKASTTDPFSSDLSVDFLTNNTESSFPRGSGTGVPAPRPSRVPPTKTTTTSNVTKPFNVFSPGIEAN